MTARAVGKRAAETIAETLHTKKAKATAAAPRTKRVNPTAAAPQTKMVQSRAAPLTKKAKSTAETPHTKKADPIPSPAPQTKKWREWSLYQTASPFPDFPRPTPEECEAAHGILKKLHQADVDREFGDENTPETIPVVLDAAIVAVLSQATSWSNAKRAMNSMKAAYGSVFAYEAIVAGGRDKLQETIRCGGLHVRKSMIIMTMLEDVRQRYGKFSLDHMFALSDEDAMRELLSYKYMGPKSASVVMGWSLKRNPFTVDTHVYRIAGSWGWRPQGETREKTQSHLEARIPPQLKFDLHFLLIAHGRSCPACRGGSKSDAGCTALGEGGKFLPAA